MPSVMRRASKILNEYGAVQSELIGKVVVLTDGKAGTVENVWLDELHGLRIVKFVPISEVNDSFDHLVGERQQCRGNGNAERFRGFEIDHEVSLLACSIGRSPGLGPARRSDIWFQAH
jgi:hypothetical protein